MIHPPWKIMFTKRGMTRANVLDKSEVTKQAATLSKQYDLNYTTNTFTGRKWKETPPSLTVVTSGWPSSIGPALHAEFNLAPEARWFCTSALRSSFTALHLCTSPFFLKHRPCRIQSHLLSFPHHVAPFLLTQNVTSTLTPKGITDNLLTASLPTRM